MGVSSRAVGSVPRRVGGAGGRGTHQWTAAFLLASVYENDSTEPDWRPKTPWRLGPTAGGRSSSVRGTRRMMRCRRRSRRLRRRSSRFHTALHDCSRAARSAARPQPASARCRRRPRRRPVRHLLARSTQARRAARSTESRLTLVGCEHVDRRARSAFWPCVTATRPGSVNEPQRAREEREGDAPPPASTVWH